MMMSPKPVVTEWTPEQLQHQQHLTCCSGVHIITFFLQMKS